jgi:hypothetical protein
MNKTKLALAAVLATGSAQADPLTGVDRFVCAASQVQICIEGDTCYSASPADLDVPEFVVIDLDDKTISTTRTSRQNRSTAFSAVSKSEGRIYLQGLEGGRAFSFVIDEASGRMSVAVSRDGMAVSVFGACTDAEL